MLTINSFLLWIPVGQLERQANQINIKNQLSKKKKEQKTDDRKLHELC